jgi:aspartyl-tRNA(Asn)/glutamyl-tRNA(Gln) amidotransferase subunit A
LHKSKNNFVMNVAELTISQISKAFKNKEFSSVDLTKNYLEQIKETDKDLNAFLYVAEESAILEAELADKKIKSGNFSELTGIPYAVKDAILVQGQKCTAGSKILENYIAPYDATVIKRLKDHGSVFLGKTNLDEFAMGSSTENSAFGPTKNPYDKTRVAGGSSGGSAAAVSANMACFSLGSDTGGSIRQPASFCGVPGLCPTYGAVSRYGLIAHASSLDQIGPFAKNIEDIKIIFKAISGKDEMDATSERYSFFDKETPLKGLKIGIPEEFFAKGLEPEVEKIIRQAIKKAELSGAKIIELRLPSSEYALACYYIIGPSEISANLARFDGIKYGLSLETESQNLLEVYLKSRGKGIGVEPKRRIMIGTYCLSSGYYDAYYKKAQEVRQLIKKDFADAFEKTDLLFCPVSPSPAFKLGEKFEDPMSMYLADIYTIPMKLAGLPGISLPAGKTEAGLPVGLQIIGNHFQENKILSVASQLEEMLK